MNRDDIGEADTFTFVFNSQEIKARPGDTIAAALLANGISSTRLTASGRARGPFCMMGACYDCLIELEGTTLQSCMVDALPGMQVSPARVTE